VRFNSWEQYSKFIGQKLTRLKDIDQYALTAANNTYRKQLTRIFVDGKNSKGGKIGTYSEKYRELKAKKFGTGGKVDLVFTGQFRAAFTVAPNPSNNTVELGFIDSSRKSLTGKSANVRNSEIREYNEDRYGAIFDMTDQESNNAIKAINFRISELIDQ